MASKYTCGRRVHCRAGTSGSSEGVNIANGHKVCASRQQTFTLIAYKYAASSETANHNLSPVVSFVRVSIATYLFQYFHSYLFSTQRLHRICQYRVSLIMQLITYHILFLKKNIVYHFL